MIQKTEKYISHVTGIEETFLTFPYIFFSQSSNSKGKE